MKINLWKIANYLFVIICNKVQCWPYFKIVNLSFTFSWVYYQIFIDVIFNYVTAYIIKSLNSDFKNQFNSEAKTLGYIIKNNSTIIDTHNNKLYATQY